MYDFYFGDKEEIHKDEVKFLISIKRMLPKWCNSIPDSEYIALFKLGDSHLKNINHPVITETGCGASTIVLAYLALKYDGTLYTWDFNGEKGSKLRNIMVETLCSYLNRNINIHWKFIAYNSTDPNLGIPIIGELDNKIDMTFHDSKHTAVNLHAEVSLANNYFTDGCLVCIDDGNYYNLYEDFSYINVFRKKLGLGPVDNPEDNIGEKFYNVVEEFLKEHWNSVEHIDDYYKHNFSKDIFFDYYEAETEIRAKMNMEKMNDLSHRFDAWRIKDRK